MSRPLLILEATTPIGRALVDQALAQGRAVVAAALDDAGLRELRATHRKADLVVLPGAANDAPSAAALVADLRELGRPLAGVIVAQCCEPRRGRVLDMHDDMLDELVREEIRPHLAAARALVPLLAEGGRNGAYLVIGGPGSEQPWAGYGLRSVAAAANRMLLRVLHDEARALSVRVQLLAVEMPTRTDDNAERACSQWPTALAIAARALALVDPQRPREPAEAVVRYAFNSLPAPDRRAVHASAAPAPPRVLDDTWRVLKPLLDSALSPVPNPDHDNNKA
jgi:NAD(P)-dependent dehydrogenase (short-subunit alcohol dehydrogenase family)